MRPGTFGRAVVGSIGVANRATNRRRLIDEIGTVRQARAGHGQIHGPGAKAISAFYQCHDLALRASQVPLEFRSSIGAAIARSLSKPSPAPRIVTFLLAALVPALASRKVERASD
jgi:hypothetical protein